MVHNCLPLKTQKQKVADVNTLMSHCDITSRLMVPVEFFSRAPAST